MRFILDYLLPTGPVMLVGDDTVDGHKGAHVYGKARHRDPVRSTHSYTAFRYGHKWVVLAVLVKFPLATRPWHLPVLIDLYRSAEDDWKRNRRHRTPARITCVLLRVVLGSPSGPLCSPGIRGTGSTTSRGSVTATKTG
ncbi:hypothetical protein VT84_20445 [Gemmata sp. SH-PL17]|uniref:hypothetical protein n=1 Tax=Gemmata sp. SH-PL17 TaxID=1630693 RepID=UPI00078D29C2|nr:hypothetical protein [Gemmata sp. SH-PL17]AMV26781.1 hypothetical protein VT84_20445 [Gemmata sp. SH-PL17]